MYIDIVIWMESGRVSQTRICCHVSFDVTDGVLSATLIGMKVTMIRCFNMCVYVHACVCVRVFVFERFYAQ